MDTKKLVIPPTDFHDQMLRVGDLDMHLVSEGDKNAPLIVLLHGFPEFWYSWRHQIQPLAAAGYHVVAPDQRGYNLTSKKAPYDPFTLAADVKNLVEALGYKKAIIIGHDWGGAVSWLVAAFYPQIVEKLIVCNCPHPVAGFQSANSFYLPQILKSWYMAFFQLPFIPEQALTVDNYRILTENMKRDTNNILSDQELTYFREAWSKPGALQAGINWYRALFQNANRLQRADTKVRVPTRLIWGDPDPHLDSKLTEWSKRWCPQLDTVFIPGAGHFVQQTAPEDVNKLILGFLQGTVPDQQEKGSC